MTLSQFIKRNMERLIADWETFARDIDSSTHGLSVAELRDRARQVLVTVADEMAAGQSSREQEQKSKGERPRHAPRITESAQHHAIERLVQGFSLNEVVAEYRAVRASVVRLWTEEMGEADREMLNQLVRFNEALDQSLTEAVRRYSAKQDEARTLFIGVLGHDVRSPLSAISSAAEFLLLSTEVIRDQPRQAALRIRDSADRISQIIEDLLDFTRARVDGGISISPVPMDLGELCMRIVEELGAFHPERKLRLERSGDLSGTWDYTRMEQTVSNLVTNALKYGRKGAPVTVSIHGEDERVVVAVHNEGEPIPQELRHVMFDPLVRGTLPGRDEQKRDGGLGLGLYIAHQVVEAHGGQIEVRSGEQEGTTFEMRLPRHAA